MNSIQAILFDLDGTLIDSEGAVGQAMQHALTVTGNAHVTEEMIEHTTGMTIEDAYRYLAPNTSNELLCNLHRDYQIENIKSTLAFPGAREMLEELKRRGIKCAVCTSRTNWIREMLAISGIDSYFSVIVGRSDVVNPKPHAEGLLYALEQLEVAPENAIMIGDSYADIGAGRNAGVAKTIAFVPGEISPRMAETMPEIVIKTLPSLLEFC